MTIFPRILLAVMTFLQIEAQAQFVFGVDLSYVNEMEDCGAVYTENGIAIDPYSIFSNHGANLVRLRLWHTPSWYDDLNDGVRYSDFADVRESIMRAKNAEMDVLLDFHLSDTWADPGHQVAPAAWSGVLNNLAVLQDSLYNYVYQMLYKLASENLLPEMVQIGNETNRGILLSQAQNDGGWVLDWDRNSALFNTAIQAVRDVEAVHQTPVQIALHVANPEEAVWYIDQFTDHGVTDFDIIGLSYYYQWHDLTFAEVTDYIGAYKSDYPDKDVMILETAYPWTTVNADGANNILSAAYPGYSPFTPANQLKWMTDLTQAVIDGGGSGVVYWEPAWVSTACRTRFALGSSWDNATFFTADDELIEEGGIGWMNHNYEFATSVGDIDSTYAGIHVYSDGEKIMIRDVNGKFKNEVSSISIISVDGKNIAEKSGIIFHESDFLLLDTDVVPGVYFIRLSGENNIYVARVFLE